jgi:hypothetical protein
VPLQREEIRVNSPRVCLTRYVPPSGFLNLSTAYSSNPPEALSHAPCTHGVFPCRAFPLKTAPCFHQAGVPRAQRTVLHPQPPACVQMNSRSRPTRRSVRANKYAHHVVFFCSQVRSHPTSVLPSVGGRCSIGFVNTFEGIFIRRPRFNESSSHVLQALPHAEALCTSES